MMVFKKYPFFGLLLLIVVLNGAYFFLINILKDVPESFNNFLLRTFLTLAVGGLIYYFVTGDLYLRRIVQANPELFPENRWYFYRGGIVRAIILFSASVIKVVCGCVTLIFFLGMVLILILRVYLTQGDLKIDQIKILQEQFKKIEEKLLQKNNQ